MGKVVQRASACIITLLFCMVACAQSQEWPWPTQTWSRAVPEEQGMDSGALAELVDFGLGNEMDSLVVTRRGRIVAEAYYAPFRTGARHRINSATKAIVSALTGIAIAQGKLASTDEAVLTLFADRSFANVDARKDAVTVQHLLDMTSGLDWAESLSGQATTSISEMRRSGDWVKFVLDRPMAHAPGTTFNYSSGNSQLLAAILRRRTGMDVRDFAAQHLFKPLGISDVSWATDPQGVATGGFGLDMQTRDMAKIGYLYLRGGEWDGQQIVPRLWVEKVFRASVPMILSATTDWRYGDQWWSLPERKAYMAVGFNRQIIVVMPETGVVAAMTGRKNYSFAQMLNRLERAVKSDAPLPPDAAAELRLSQRIEDVARLPQVR
jgi:CubicO group peptidase (beta-lactamase class C family)